MSREFVLILIFAITVNSLVKMPIRRSKSKSEIKVMEFFIKKFKNFNGNFKKFIETHKKCKFVSTHHQKIKEYYREYTRRYPENTNLYSTNYNLPITLGTQHYSGILQMGNPPQNVNISIDTGSSDLWVAGTGCTESVCQGMTLFNPATSTLIPQIFSDSYGSGSVSGYVYQDSVGIAGLTAQNFKFGVVTQISQNGVDFSGLLGLGPLEASSIPQDSIVKVLHKQGLIDNAIFSLYLSQNAQSFQNQLIIGGTDSTFYTGDIKYYPRADSVAAYQVQYWAVSVTSITFNNQNYGPAIVAVDSGAPSNGVSDALESAITSGCGAGSNVIYQIGSDTYSLSCQQSFSGSDVFIFGDPFITQYYTVFDIENHTIGFALAIN